MYFLHARYWREQNRSLLIKPWSREFTSVFIKQCYSVLFMAEWNPHLFQALLTEGTVRCMVQAAFQTVFTEGVSAWRGHGLIKQPAFIRNRVLLNAPLFERNNYSGCMLPAGWHVPGDTSCKEHIRNHWDPTDLWRLFCGFSLWQAVVWSFWQHLKAQGYS